MTKCKYLLLSVAALAPATALADVSFYFGGGSGGVRVEENLNLTFAAFEYDGGVLIPVFDRVGSGDPAAGNFNPRFGQPVSESMDKFKGTDLGYRVFGGVRFWRFFGIEAGYVNLGQPRDQIELNVPNFSGPDDPNEELGYRLRCANCRPVTDLALEVEDEIDGWELYALGALPISERWEAFAKIGVVAWDSTISVKNPYDETFDPSPPDSEPFKPTTTPSSFESDTDGTDLAGGLGFNYRISDRITLRGEGTWYAIEDIDLSWLLAANLIITY